MEYFKTILMIFGVLLISTVQAAPFGDDGGTGIIPGEQNGALEVLAEAGNFVWESLFIPPSDNPQTILMVLAGYTLIIYGFYKAVSNFDDRVGWINNTREQLLIGFLLSLVFVGGVNVSGWISSVLIFLVIGVGIFAVFLILSGPLAGLAAGSTVLGFFGEAARTSPAGTYGGAGLNWLDSNNVWPFNNATVSNAWNEYQNWEDCPNDHLNPGKSPGDDCWLCGDTI